MNAQIAFAVEFAGIADTENYVLVADEGSIDLYILDEDGDREYLEGTTTLVSDLAALATEITNAKQAGRYSDLYDAAQVVA